MKHKTLGLVTKAQNLLVTMLTWRRAHKRSLVMRPCSATALLYWCNKSSLPLARRPVSVCFFNCFPILEFIEPLS